jgi:hypothetical protein
MTFRPFVLAALAVSPAIVRAQVVTLDEGTFVISQNGTKIGSESFSITMRRTPGMAGVVQARATVSYDDRKLSPTLRSDSLGAIGDYTRGITGSGDESLTGRVARGRFSATVQTPRGESRVDLPITDQTVMLDDFIFHQHYFVAQRAGGTVSAVIPARGILASLQVESRGTENVTIGGASLRATHLAVRDPGGDDRDIWVDAQGHVLKVAIPSKGIIALRQDPPK